MQFVSDQQFAQALVLAGTIMPDEAPARVTRGDLPKAMTDAPVKLPETDGRRFGACMMLAAATTHERPPDRAVDVLLVYDAATLDAPRAKPTLPRPHPPSPSVN